MERLRAEVSRIIGTQLVTEETIEQLIAFIKRYGDNLYNEGYDEGDSCGYNRGHHEGKKEGYDKGKEDGFEDGRFGTISLVEQDPFLPYDTKRRIVMRLRG